MLSDVSQQMEILETLNLTRDKMAVISGMATDEMEARNEKPNVPKIAVIAPAMDYVTTDGEKIKKEEVDILIKVVSMGKFHRPSPASGLYNIAACTLLPGTIPNKIAGFGNLERERMIRIGHPEGIVEVRVTLNPERDRVEKVGMERTVRRIMKGDLFITKEG